MAEKQLGGQRKRHVDASMEWVQSVKITGSEVNVHQGTSTTKEIANIQGNRMTQPAGISWSLFTTSGLTQWAHEENIKDGRGGSNQDQSVNCGC